EAANIDDRIHHQNVADADPLLDLTAGERADHELGNAKGQRPHRRRADGGACRTAQAEDAVDTALPMQIDNKPGRTARRCFDSLAAIVSSSYGFQRCASSSEEPIAADIR